MTCKYSHDYLLNQQQLQELANNAKKAPCNWLKNGAFTPVSGESKLIGFQVRIAPTALNAAGGTDARVALNVTI
jgi:hypothetical protein